MSNNRINQRAECFGFFFFFLIFYPVLSCRYGNIIFMIIIICFHSNVGAWSCISFSFQSTLWLNFIFAGLKTADSQIDHCQWTVSIFTAINCLLLTTGHWRAHQFQVSTLIHLFVHYFSYSVLYPNHLNYKFCLFNGQEFLVAQNQNPATKAPIGFDERTMEKMMNRIETKHSQTILDCILSAEWTMEQHWIGIESGRCTLHGSHKFQPNHFMCVDKSPKTEV